ncbi:hypothetical protein [Pseudomonas typographi]|uniref:hypothetical protein n=1 Tax=Pseudomonas typographi TaxID=2715964 RepID=UPI001686315F|nr:hypothetical protein [Pseudomonas typographi]
MSIPVNALKGDELLHYASLDQGAANELARQIAESDFDPIGDIEELEEELDDLKNALEESESQVHEMECEMEEARHWIRRAMGDEERDLSVNELLQKALDCLE